MKLPLLILISTIVLTSFSSKPKRVIFFGDSLTELGAQKGGYIPRIDSMARAEKRKEDFEFVGAGVGGNKVYDLYLRMEEDVLAKEPDIVVIFIGINDIWHKVLVGTGTDPDRFERFYNAILKKLKDRNIKAILCTPTVIGEKNDMTNQQDGELNAYSEMVRGIAKKHDLPLVDLRKAFLEYLVKNNPQNKEKGILTYDRVHFSAKGNQLVAEEIWNVLRK